MTLAPSGDLVVVCGNNGNAAEITRPVNSSPPGR
jgi:hypothetical protein